MHFAVSKGSHSVLHQLLYHWDIKPDVKSFSRRTPMAEAVARLDLMSVSLLAHKGVPLGVPVYVPKCVANCALTQQLQLREVPKLCDEEDEYEEENPWLYSTKEGGKVVANVFESLCDSLTLGNDLTWA